MKNKLIIEIQEVAGDNKKNSKTLKETSGIKSRMLSYNAKYVKNYRRFSIFLKDKVTKDVKGGLCCYIQSGVMFVETLIIDEEFRGQKWGTKILQKAEDIAKQNNCNCIYLDTFTFQALPFYEKLGYEVFAKLDEYDDGIILYWLKKKIKYN